MSDLIDVMTVLEGIVAAAVYPNGTGQPSVTNLPILVEMGWPASEGLNVDLKNGKCHVSIYASQQERNTTRYAKIEQVVTAAVPTLTATVSGNTITIGGTVTTPQNIALVISGVSYTYAVQPINTLTSIATALATAIGASSSGAVITVSTGSIQAARVGASAGIATEVRRQERVFMVTVWADTPQHRDVIGAAFDLVLAQTEFLSMPDGFAARLVYKNSPVTDNLQKTGLYRRDFNYSVEYATTVASTAAQVITTVTNVSPNSLSAIIVNK